MGGSWPILMIRGAYLIEQYSWYKTESIFTSRWPIRKLRGWFGYRVCFIRKLICVIGFASGSTTYFRCSLSLTWSYWNFGIQYWYIPRIFHDMDHCMDSIRCWILFFNLGFYLSVAMRHAFVEKPSVLNMIFDASLSSCDLQLVETFVHILYSWWDYLCIPVYPLKKFLKMM